MVALSEGPLAKWLDNMSDIADDRASRIITIAMKVIISSPGAIEHIQKSLTPA